MGIYASVLDYCKVNVVSQFDAYPMPGSTSSCSFFQDAKFDQGLLPESHYLQSHKKTAFSTPYNLYHFITLLFGMFGTPATFQCLMDQMLHPRTAYIAAYLDDVIIHSDT